MGDAQYSLNHLIQVSGNDAEFMIEILEMFLLKANEEVNQTKQLIAEKQWQNAQFVVHRLRSSAGSVGAKKIARSCSELESYLLSSDDVEKSVNLYLDQFIDAARSETAEIKTALTKLKGGGHD